MTSLYAATQNAVRVCWSAVGRGEDELFSRLPATAPPLLSSYPRCLSAGNFRSFRGERMRDGPRPITLPHYPALTARCVDGSGLYVSEALDCKRKCLLNLSPSDSFTLTEF